jgi:nicotinamidase-related amidase
MIDLYRRRLALGAAVSLAACAAPSWKEKQLNTTAVLVIDVQETLAFGDEAAFEGDRVVRNANALIAAARVTGAPVVFTLHEEAEGGLVRGSPGWQLATGLTAEQYDLRVRKTTVDPYFRTGLERLLRDRGTTRVVVCGLQSDFCVDSTVRRSLALGFDVTLASDAHSNVNGVLPAAQATAHHNRILSFMTAFGPRIDVIPTARVKV